MVFKNIWLQCKDWIGKKKGKYRNISYELFNLVQDVIIVCYDQNYVSEDGKI